MRSKHRSLSLKTALRLGLFGLVVLATLAPASAIERGPYSIEIVVDGRPLDELRARGATYVEAIEGRDYTLRLRNHTSRRVAVAVSVDGLNVIDAKTTTTRGASKWILDPHQTLTLEGWQTGSSTARRFFFTTEERSYGAWLGKTTDLGVISAAFFRERLPDPAPITRPSSEMNKNSEGAEGKRRSDSPSKRQLGRESGRDRSAGEPSAPVEQELSDDLAATGIGREIEHRVQRVRFDAEPSPAAVMEVRYEYRDALVRLGVLPSPPIFRDNPLERREHACGFQDPDFAPDPYRR